MRHEPMKMKACAKCVVYANCAVCQERMRQIMNIAFGNFSLVELMGDLNDEQKDCLNNAKTHMRELVDSILETNTFVRENTK